MSRRYWFAFPMEDACSPGSFAANARAMGAALCTGDDRPDSRMVGEAVRITESLELLNTGTAPVRLKTPPQ